MVSKLLDKCCDRCWHDTTRPCPSFISCIHTGPICHSDEECRKKRSELVLGHQFLRTEVPVFFVGASTCGLGAGAAKTIGAIRDYLDRKHIEARIVEVGCIGLCAFEPMVDIKFPGRPRMVYGNVRGEDIEALLDKVFSGDFVDRKLIGQHRAKEGLETEYEGIPYFDEHPFFAKQSRCVLENCGIIDPDSIEHYIAVGGYLALEKVLKEKTPDEVIDTIEKSGLRGRGGGGFPTGRKWRIAADAPSEQKYLICNADEGDPGAFMDRAVIEGDPHRLVEGMVIAAYAIGARKAYVYIRAEYPLAIKRLEKAIRDAYSCGFLGHNILDSGFSLNILIKRGAGAFVCGEETALIHSIEGKRGMPRPRPPYPAVKGLFGKPTVINNVETLANVPAIVRKGADWFSSMGTQTSKGTKVFALSGKVERTGLVEVEMGTTIREIVFDIGGGVPDGRRFKAVQIGGPSGGCIPEKHIDTPVDYESLRSLGAMMGSGGLVVMDDKTCMVDVAKFFMGFIQRESCGKCIPCREGTQKMLNILNQITRSRRGEKPYEALERFKGIMYLNRLAEVIKDTSLCGLGQTAPNPVLSTLRWFRDEYEEHIYLRRCPAGVCKELLRYSIDPEKCKGCTLCAKKCPVGAIVGNARTPHYIVEDKCIGCGTCYEVCKFGAVLVG